MGHGDFVRPDGQWPNHFVPSPIDLQKFDRAQFEALNGDDGGTYAPETPIVIGGQCVQLIGAGPHILSGGVMTQYGGRLALGHSDWPAFTTPQTRSLVAPLVGARTDIADSYQLENSLDPVGTLVTSVLAGPIQWTIPQRYMHNGATLSTATVTFRVGAAHLFRPTTAPHFNLQRMTLGHASVSSMGSGSFTLPATPEQYYAGGAAQSMTASVTLANVIDVSQYTYILQLYDESGFGAQAGNVYTSITLGYTGIVDMRSE